VSSIFNCPSLIERELGFWIQKAVLLPLSLSSMSNSTGSQVKGLDWESKNASPNLIWRLVTNRILRPVVVGINRMNSGHSLGCR